MHQDRPRRQIALITGASRGIGAEIAGQLATPDYHVIINYREKAKRANAVAEAVQNAGGSASIAQADLTDETAVVGMLDHVKNRCGRLDVLVLNASGGLERGADPGYPMRLNRDAQVDLVKRALPLIPRGGRLVFITSHQAHFHGHKPVPREYEPIAASKRAGEDALRRMRPVLDQHGITLVVVSGDMIDGTIIVRLLERRDPGAVAARRQAATRLPTVAEFAEAVAQAIRDPHPTGQAVYVGGNDYLSPRP